MEETETVAALRECVALLAKCNLPLQNYSITLSVEGSHSHAREIRDLAYEVLLTCEKHRALFFNESSKASVS